MVTPKNRFLIDAAFIVEQTHKTFFGAPLMTATGRDHTFTFGCVRDFLRLRRKLGINVGVLIIGKEAYSFLSRDSVLDLIAILNELKIPHIHDPLNLGLHVASRFHSEFSHIVTADRRFLQFCTDNLIVVLPREGKQIEWDWMSSETVKTMMGIVPKEIPTYLTLTDLSSAAALTNKQAIRLVELHGNIDSIYGNLGQVVSGQIRRKLAECESSIRECYAGNRCEPVGSPMLSPAQDDSLHELDTANSRQLLMRYGFHSLLTLLEILSISGLTRGAVRLARSPTMLWSIAKGLKSSSPWFAHRSCARSTPNPMKRIHGKRHCLAFLSRSWMERPTSFRRLKQTSRT